MLNSTPMGLTPTHKKKINTLKSSSEAVSEMNKEFPICRKVTYEEILNSLKESQRREEKLASKIVQKRKII